MKKIIAVLAVALMFASCTDQEPAYENSKAEIEATGQGGGSGSGDPIGGPPKPPCHPNC